MSNFELNCLQELTSALACATTAVTALLAYKQGASDYEAQNGKQTAQTYNLIEEEKEISKDGYIQVNFTQKELNTMPLQFKKEYRLDGTIVHCRKRPCGSSFTYEMRYRRNGYNVTATAKRLEDCKAKFIAKLKLADKEIKNNKNKLNFENFTLYYYENFKKRKVTAQTYEKDLIRVKKHLLPTFGNKNLNQITPSSCQAFLDGFANAGKTKTAEELYYLLNQLFKSAINHNYINQNPLAIIIKPAHEREHGTALTLAEERQFVEAVKNDKFFEIFIVALYTGMRPNEYQHSKIENGFISTINSKRKGGKVEYKKIAISPMLAPYITSSFVARFNEIKANPVDTIRTHFQAIMPTRKLYDLRTTFYTRCQTCGVAEPARDFFVGHSSGVLADTYTDLNNEYLIQEAQKLKYAL